MLVHERKNRYTYEKGKDQALRAQEQKKRRRELGKPMRMGGRLDGRLVVYTIYISKKRMFVNW